MPETRQLAAIMFTDIVGYTAMMGENEAGAYQLLKKNRQVQKPLIEKHNGRWLKEMGDGVLASFQTVLDAVYCAIEIQKTCLKVPDLKLRIGIHLGDVIVEDGDVFGDGVNIASRLESITPTGGIYVSEPVYMNIQNKEEIKAEFVREETLKNVKYPVRVYEIQIEGIDPTISDAIQQKTEPGIIRHIITWGKKPLYILIFIVISIVLAYLGYQNLRKNEFTKEIEQPQLIEKSIAVLPFTNMSNDPAQDYFADGIMEEILTHLCKIGDLKVISRTSTMRYRGTDKSMSDIARELGVTYVLEGSVRKSNDKVRITTQLINAQNNIHLWAEYYDKDMVDIFSLQSEVAQQVAIALKANISPEVRGDIEDPPTTNYKAYDLYLQGNKYLTQYKPEENRIAISLFKKALSLDSTFAMAYAKLAGAYSSGVLRFGYGKTMLDSAEYYAKLSILYDVKQSEGYKILGLVERTKNNLDLAISYTRKAINMNPNQTTAITNLGFFLVTNGEFQEGKYFLDQGITLNPRNPEPFNYLGILYYYIGNYSKSIDYFERSLEIEPDNRFALLSYLISLKARQDWESLEVFSNKTLKYTKDSITWHKTKGIIYYSQSDFKRALYHFSCANDTLYMADCYMKLGDKELAIEILKKLRVIRGQSWLQRPGSWADFRISYDLILINLLLGNSQEVCKWIRTSLKEGRDFMYQLFINEPILNKDTLTTCAFDALNEYRMDLEKRSSGYQSW
jgi:TolB-like protein/class 3 adenylate cyclase